MFCYFYHCKEIGAHFKLKQKLNFLQNIILLRVLRLNLNFSKKSISVAPKIWLEGACSIFRQIHLFKSYSNLRLDLNQICPFTFQVSEYFLLSNSWSFRFEKVTIFLDPPRYSKRVFPQLARFRSFIKKINSRIFYFNKLT